MGLSSPQLQFTVTNQVIRRIDNFQVVGDSQNYLYASFNFLTEEWEGLVKTALFRNGIKGQVYEVILDNDACLVPHEVLAGNDNYMFVSVFAGELITVNKEKVYIETSGYWDDAESSVDPTPSVYQQIMDRLEHVEDTVVESATSASESAESASQSAQSASEDAETASASATASAASAEDSATMATLAESWAIGGTNTRTGEDINNAKYYAELAQQAIPEASDWSNIRNKPTTLDGYGVESVPVSKLDGIIDIDNLPQGALERFVTVANDTSRFALTINDVQNGDVVKVTETDKLYYVIDDTKLNSELGYQSFAAGTASSVPWSGITNKPTTLSGYGITDAVKKETGKGLSSNDYTDTEKAKLSGIESGAQVNTIESIKKNGTALTPDANKAVDITVPTKITDLTNDSSFVVDANYVHTDNNLTATLKAKLDGIAEGAEVNVNADWNAGSGDAQILNKPTTLAGYGVSEVPASMVSGVLSIDNIPPSALERLVQVVTDTMRFRLTKTSAQNGDTVKVISTGKLYLVIDDDNLDKEAGYMEYNVGSASSVPWSGVTNTPTTLAGYGITDAQGVLTWDQTPTQNSANPVTSGGVYSAIQNVEVSEEMTYAQYSALSQAQKMNGVVRYITDVNNIPSGEGVRY